MRDGAGFRPPRYLRATAAVTRAGIVVPMMLRPRVAGLAIALLAVAGLAGVVPTGLASAQPPPEESAQGSMMFVLDASGSMVAPLPSGGTRMDAAKAAMNTLIDGLPVNIHVGLEVYGTGTGNAESEKAAGCQDVRILQPVGRVDKQAMRAHVAGITPRGYTPIGRSLEQAAAGLPSEGPRAIVLVSDGIDTCAPPAPCEVAKTLTGAGVALAVHTVGFQVDPAARAELECVASATGGEYHDAPDAESLDDLLPEIANRALRFYDVTGSTASGAKSLDEAEYLPPGQYADMLDKDTPYYYEVHVPAGATGHFTVVHVVELNSERHDSGVDLRLVDAEQRTCAQGRGFREYIFDGPETASVSWTPRPDDVHCDPGGPHFLEVRWNNKRDVPSDEVELVVSLEAPVDGDRGPDAAGESVPFREPSGGPDIVWGGGSFNEAATLPGAGRYLDKIHYSEYSIYKVWLDWGQGLAYRVRFQDGEPALGTATAVTEWRGPTRYSAREHAWTSTDYSGTQVSLRELGTPPVRYANRDGDDRARYAAQAGWYYIVVKLSPVWTNQAPVPDAQPAFELAVHIDGERIDGPRYAELATPSSAPPRPTTKSTWTPPSSSAADASLVASEGARPVLWWTLGGLAAALVATIAVLIIFRRKPTGANDAHQPRRS